MNFCNNVREVKYYFNIWGIRNKKERRGLRKRGWRVKISEKRGGGGGGWKFTHFTSPGSVPEQVNLSATQATWLIYRLARVLFRPKCPSKGGHPKTQTMQTANHADCIPCRLCRPRRLSTFFLTLGSLFAVLQFWNSVQYVLMFVIIHRPHRANSISYCWFNKRNVFNRLCMENSLYCSSLNILNSSIKNKVPYILGANCFNFWRVCGFTSFVQFVVIVFFDCLIVFVPLLTGKDGYSKWRHPTNRSCFPKYRIAIRPGVFPLSIKALVNEDTLLRTHCCP